MNQPMPRQDSPDRGWRLSVGWPAISARSSVNFPAVKSMAALDPTDNPVFIPLTQCVNRYSCRSGAQDYASTTKVYAPGLCEVAGHDLNPQFAIDSDRDMGT